MTYHCLSIETQRKHKDNLPNVVINGARLCDHDHPDQKNYPGYYLVKLPMNDPRAYILGHITNCCQSIGGNGETCVIDGITRANNGFYVLLKRKSRVETCQHASCDGRVEVSMASASASPFAGKDVASAGLQISSTASSPELVFDDLGTIRYDLFDMVGQGYAWISRNGNLTIDSWENLTPIADDPVIIDMLTRLGEAATNDPQSPGMTQLTIGIGGKTPTSYKVGALRLKTPEMMKEGCSYGDAEEQALYAFHLPLA